MKILERNHPRLKYYDQGFLQEMQLYAFLLHRFNLKIRRK